MNTLFELTSPMTRVFDAAFSPSHTLSSHALPSGRSPRADVLEGAKAFQVIMDLPGVQTSDLEISLENQTLSVKAPRQDRIPADLHPGQHHRRKQNRGPLQRRRAADQPAQERSDAAPPD